MRATTRFTGTASTCRPWPAAWRWLRAAVLLAAAGVLTGCGGGVSLGFGFGDFDGFDRFAPRVSITTASTVVQAGQSLRLAAAAADENGIDRVIFFRLDGDRWELLGSDGTEPFEWLMVVPADGRTTLSVFAQAVDRTGHTGDSQVLTLTVLP